MVLKPYGMTLRGAANVSLNLSVALALLTVLVSGDLPAAFWVALAAMPLATVRGFRVPAPLGASIAGLALATAIGVMVSRGTAVIASATIGALVAVLVARALTRQGVRHDRQILLLALLLVFAGSVVHWQITYGLLFILFAMAAAVALVTCELLRGTEIESERTGVALGELQERRDIVTLRLVAATGLVALAVLASTSVLFVIFPRVGIANLGFLAHRRNVYPQEVSLRGAPRADAGNQALVRVRGVPRDAIQRGLYLAGSRYGVASIGGFQSGDVPATDVEVVRDAIAYEVFTQPIFGDRLPALGLVNGVHLIGGGQSNPSRPTRVWVDGSGVVRASPPVTGPIKYRVHGTIASQQESLARVTPAPAAQPAYYLRLPADLDARVTELALRLTAGVTTLDEQVAAIRRHLAVGYAYALEAVNTDKHDPLAAFLFEDRRGHCEYFATAFAMLLRAAGIASRAVGGFHGGRWDETDGVVVFGSANAHAWVEWYLPGTGWILDDATPAATAPPESFRGLAALFERMGRYWDDQIVDYGFGQQMELLDASLSAAQSAWHVPMTPTKRSAAWIAACAAATTFVALRLRRRRIVHDDPLRKALMSCLRRRLGRSLNPSETPREALLRADPAIEVHGRALLAEALHSYERQRYDQQALPPAVVRRLVRGLARL